MAAQTFILTSLCIGEYDKWASQAHRAITRRGIALMVKTRKAAANTILVCDRWCNALRVLHPTKAAFAFPP